MPRLWRCSRRVCTSIRCIYLVKTKSGTTDITLTLANYKLFIPSNSLFKVPVYCKVDWYYSTTAVQFFKYLVLRVLYSQKRNHKKNSHTSTSGRCSISSTFCTSPLAAALTTSSFRSPETWVSNNFFSSALNRSVIHCTIRIQGFQWHAKRSKSARNMHNMENISIKKLILCML